MRRKAYDPSKQYLVACHPHGFLIENIGNIFTRGCPEFNTTGIMRPYPAWGQPGGFSEAVYTGASKDYDHAYLAGRGGFLKLAIERGIDVAPIYGFGVASAYSGLHVFEGSRHTGEPSCPSAPGCRECCPSANSAAPSPTTRAT